MSNEERSGPGAARSWITALRRYALFMGPANLAWETLQVPLYTIWREGTSATSPSRWSTARRVIC